MAAPDWVGGLDAGVEVAIALVFLALFLLSVRRLAPFQGGSVYNIFRPVTLGALVFAMGESLHVLADLLAWPPEVELLHAVLELAFAVMISYGILGMFRLYGAAGPRRPGAEEAEGARPPLPRGPGGAGP